MMMKIHQASRFATYFTKKNPGDDFLQGNVKEIPGEFFVQCAGCSCRITSLHVQ